jgi:hypothetical protein
VFFLVNPHLPPGRQPADPKMFNTVNVLRVSADGKEQVTLSPAAAPKFASSKDLTTLAIAMGHNGTLFMLVLAEWQREGGVETKGQYILSFDQKGKYLSHVEVDWRDILVYQFEPFGSGAFLLRGRRTNTAEERVAILSTDGVLLQDVIEYPSKTIQESTPSRKPRFDHMVRGGDGRIYLLRAERDNDVVYALSPDGACELAFKLTSVSSNSQLTNWSAAGDRLAATYMEPDPSGGHKNRWWIAVYRSATAHGRVEALYGPLPGPPLCYHHGQEDRFTLLADEGRLVTMSR